MTFIRVKNIKNKITGKDYPYAYVVANSWKQKKVRQKVKRYLGRVYYFKRREKSFQRFVKNKYGPYLDIVDQKQIVIDLVKWELVNHGFTIANGCYVNGDCIFEVNKRIVCNKSGKYISIAMNDGLLCSYLLRKILRFNFKGNEDEKMYSFAKEFVELGIKVPHEVFVGLYEMVIK